MLSRLRHVLLVLRFRLSAQYRPRRLSPQPGDVFVIRAPGALLADDPEYLRLLARRLRDGIHRQTGARVQVLILAEDLDLALVNDEYMGRHGWVRRDAA